MDQREVRRDRTIRIGRRRQKLHLNTVHANQLEKLDCVCEISPWRFAKRRALGECNCRRKPRGAPHYGTGCCHGRQGLRPAVRARRAWHQVRHLWQAGLTADDKFDRGEV